MLLMTKEPLALAKKDPDYLNELMKSEEAHKFVKYVIKEYTKSPARFMAVNKVEWEDLLQAAYIGLFKAIKKINLNLSVNEWIRYSFLSIQGELRNFSRSNDSNMVVISQRIRELYPKYRKFHEEYWVRYQKDPSIAETMQFFRISKDDAFDLVYGMQEMIYQKTRETIKGRTVTQSYEHVKSRTLSVEDQAINRMMVKVFLDQVSEKQRNILYLHYFKGFSKAEVSRMIGCSQSMVTKHLAAAFKKIRKELSTSL